MATTTRHSNTLALAHALSAAERGLPVFPLSPTKLPALRSPHRETPGTPGTTETTGTPGTSGAPGTSATPGTRAAALCRGECGLPGHGVYDATTDSAAIRALFAAAPWATGYGIACGHAPHHLIGIDLDITPTTANGDARGANATPDSVAALQQLAFQHLFTLPETVVVLTPSGGRHIWLSGPSDISVPNSAGRLAPGIDVRGAGGYLVGPGSVTARGAYRIDPGTAGLAPAPCPRALLRLLVPPETRSPRGHAQGLGHGSGHRPDGGSGHGEHRGRAAPAQGQGLVQFVLAAHEGQRNTRLFWAACRAYEHGFGDALVESLVDAAVRAGLTEREARATIASAARLTAGPYGQ